MQINNSNCFLLLVPILLSFTTVETYTRHIPPFFESDGLNFALEQTNDRAKIDKVSLNFRLPNETYPEQYDIKLTTNVHKGEKPFQGEVVIDIVVVQATSKIVLHARQLVVSKVSIINPSTGENEQLSYEYEEEREFLTLTRNNGKQFAAETKWKLTIIYNGKLRDDNGGFYISKYIDDNGKERYLATTQFESTNARHAFPCYDEPDKRANFTITILHDPTYNVISNMPINAARSSNGTTVFLTTARIPTYIVAFIVSDFASTGGTLNNLPQHIFSRPSKKHAHSWALVSSMLITQRLSEYYGVDFMLPKMDHVAVPDFSPGGMENWGLATYREEYLLYDEHNSTVLSQTSIANILAHEIAHQWFGDLVAIKWWTYLWLKEGFATLFSYRALADAYPEWDVWQEFVASTYQTALTNDGINNPRPMTYYVQKPGEISGVYDSVSYGKAGAVLYMWSNALTDKVFQRGLHNFLTNNQYTAAAEEQLFTAIQIAAKEENYKIPATINEMMSSWSHQGGYPLLTVTRNYEDGTFTVKQESFHNNETFKTEKKWYVPINYVESSKHDFRNTEATHYLLNVTEIKINAEIAKNDWLMLNKQSAYYYRIKYDDENYKLIINSLIEKPFKIHVRNRAQLMHDAFRFSISNRLDHGLFLKMITYLTKEDQYAPWSTARNIIINTLDRYLRGDQDYDGFRLFIADLVEPIYTKLGIDDVPGEQHYQKYTRNLVVDLACLAGVEDCLQETSGKLKAYVKGETVIEPNLQKAIFCNGLKQSGDEEFNFLHEQLMDSADSALRSLLLSGLGCTQNESHLKKFLHSSIDQTNKLQNRERNSLLSSVYPRSGAGLLACIEFLNENWNEYSNIQTGISYLDYDMRNMANYVVNKNQEEKYLGLLAKVKDSKHVSDSLENDVKATIARNFQWLNNHRGPIMTWVAQYHTEKFRNGSTSLAASAVLLAFAFMSTVIRLF